jgi:hypothetical protein
MNDHCAYDTAKRLEQAGFPKPEIQFGQVWYDGLQPGEWGVITGINRGFAFAFNSCLGGYERVFKLDERFTFAPTATDILKELPGWHILFSNFSLPNGEQKKMWRCACDDERLDEFYHENPAEATAKAYLAINEKK